MASTFSRRRPFSGSYPIGFWLFFSIRNEFLFLSPSMNTSFRCRTIPSSLSPSLSVFKFFNRCRVQLLLHSPESSYYCERIDLLICNVFQTVHVDQSEYHYFGTSLIFYSVPGTSLSISARRMFYSGVVIYGTSFNISELTSSK